MLIFILKTNKEIISIEVYPDYTIDAVKNKIYEITLIPQNQQRLLFKNKQLEDSRSLSDYNVQKEATLTMVLRLRGD